MNSSFNLLREHLDNSSASLCLGVLLSVLFAVPSVDADQANAKNLAEVFTPYRALYQIELSNARQGSNVSDARGAMFYRFEPLCTGWEVETRVSMRLTHESVGTSDDVKTTWSFTSFENYNAGEFTFSVDHLQNGLQAQVYSGIAEKNDDSGSAFFDGEDVMDVELPKGALYPAEHLMRVLGKAMNGEKTDFSIVFDGASMKNPYRVNTIILGQVMANADNSDEVVLRGTPASFNEISKSGASSSPVWRVRMAYFPSDDMGGAPEFELEVDFREDGVAQQMVQDFGDFQLRLTPSLIEVLPQTPCE